MDKSFIALGLLALSTNALAKSTVGANVISEEGYGEKVAHFENKEIQACALEKQSNSFADVEKLTITAVKHADEKETRKFVTLTQGGDSKVKLDIKKPVTATLDGQKWELEPNVSGDAWVLQGNHYSTFKNASFMEDLVITQGLKLVEVPYPTEEANYKAFAHCVSVISK